ncbi:ArsR family transcriptional regulator [Methylobacterium sp. 4-46]|uniref:ArsR family transcriptional regulator n=1 Tax=Methylobacterium sp. (strain 4-46) TaxID=426117 RepID=UPI00223FCAAB|nr:ArsR family transcriptional regulator [Methylobacterium sp. 4-46]
MIKQDGVFLTVSELSERDKISKPTVSLHIKRLCERHNLEVERDARGRVRRVNSAMYDLLRERYGDPSKAQAPKSVELMRSADDSYDEATRRRAWYDVEKRRLEVDELRGALVRRDRLVAAVTACGEALTRSLDLLSQEADSLAEVQAREGDHGLRKALRALGRRIREEQAAALTAVAKTAAQYDEPLPDESTPHHGRLMEGQHSP